MQERPKKDINKKSKGKAILRVAFFFCIACAAAVLFLVISNLLMVQRGKKKLVSDEELKKAEADCILILGAGVWEGGRPSPMLEDRLKEGIRLYNEGICSTILVSGDHGRTNYDEVNVMKDYLIEAGIPSEAIFMDHAGFSTYESMYRAKEIFGVSKAIIVTQEYHMYRSLYDCKCMGIEAYGSPTAPRIYGKEKYRMVREWLARDKDILFCLFKAEPTFHGERIDIHGDGNLTND